ncbi:MAG: VWA domain-containing protein [Planctomycetota bacterium]
MHQRQAPPELHLDFAEEFFGAFWNRFRKRDRLRYADTAAHFDSMSGSLSAVAQAFAGRHVMVRCAEASGGLQKHVILLPRVIALSPEVKLNREFIFARAALAGAMVAKQDQSSLEKKCNPLEAEIDFLDLAVSTARALSFEHQGFHERMRKSAELELSNRPEPHALRGRARAYEELRQSALHALCSDLWAGLPQGFVEEASKLPSKGIASPPVLLFGGVLSPSEQTAVQEIIAEEETPGGIHTDSTEVQAPLKDYVERILLEGDQEYKDAMPEHAFEKVSFAEKYEGGYRRLDGEDDMDEQQQSLDSVDLRELIRGGPEVHSIYQADIGDAEGIPDVAHVKAGERGILYPEWDLKARRYRENWVTVYPTPLPGADIDAAQELRTRLASTVRVCLRRLERQRTERRSLNRQLDGQEIDIEAVVEDHAALRSGRTPSGRIYQHTPRLDRDIATTVLLDLSLSADSWVSNRRVLEVEQEAAFVLGEVAEKMGDSLQILAYASNTRNLCRIWEIKGWDDSWQRGSARLGLLKPQGYTRIGPAIRHGCKQLEQHRAKHKHLILITDAKPTDFDRYEGEYGIHDVRQAVREASTNEINVHALGIDPKCAGILPVMFGVRGWRLLPHLADLPETLIATYGNFC